MNILLRCTSFTFALAALTAVGPASEQGPSQASLAMLDPVRQAAGLCGRAAQDTLRQRLRLASLFATAASAAEPGPMPLYPGLQGLRFPVTTASPEARRYFLQGLLFAYGFNHAAAIRSFKEAQKHDPACAACFWGEALAYGPNINAPMDPDALQATLAAVERAKAQRSGASPAEQALIDALALRYSADPKADRAALDTAYADAMLDVARRFPDHDDIALLAAEAVMDTRPWDYWEADRRTPKGRIGDAIRLVEAVLARNPADLQAEHLYIHLIENNADPARAEKAADLLARGAPSGVGHLVHMPAHIYYRLGRFRESIDANVKAARADEAYLKGSADAGMYRYGYYPHNVHFIVTSAQMAGDMPTAIREAKRLESVLSADLAAQFPWTQAVNAAPYLAYAQFATPDKILALPPPDTRLTYVAGMRHYARAVAYAQRRDRTRFDAELAALRTIRTTGSFDAMVAQNMPGPDLLLLAETVARARFASVQGRYGEAARLYRDAIAIEDRIPYMEPPYWYYPVHQSLGAALYRAGRYDDARQAFRDALIRWPANGWALYGLAASERALGHRVEAAAAERALSKAWLGDRRWLRMDRI